jgi:hypothetical protein
LKDRAPADELTRSYDPSPATGWATIGQDDYSPLSAILQLVTLLFQKRVLPNDESFEVFNKAAAIRLR